MVLRNKVAIVTGSSSGIGAAIAIELAKQGANVVITGRNEEKLNKVLINIEKVSGKKPLVVVGDVTDDDQAKQIIDTTVTTFRQIDILVNNAGASQINDILEPNAIEAFDSILKTNLRAVAVITHYAIPHLIASRGNIVNISSVCAEVAFGGFVPYCTSKAGLDHYSKCLAFALADHGVRVNVVNPGQVATNMMSNMGLDTIQETALTEDLRKSLPLQRISDASEVADIVAFLVSDKAKGVTGSKYLVDNGQRLCPPSISVIDN